MLQIKGGAFPQGFPEVGDISSCNSNVSRLRSRDSQNMFLGGFVQ